MPSEGNSKRNILFVCLGNICRSPIAEAVFLDLIKKRGEADKWNVDSSAIIGYHTGKSPERRALATLKKFGITDYVHKARVLLMYNLVLWTSTADIRNFDFVFGMDDSNIADLRDLAKMVDGKKGKIQLLGEFDPQGHRIVPDPYYEDGVEMFEQVYHQCVRCCSAFLDSQK